MLTYASDRRAHPRTSVIRPGKIFEPRSSRYHACTTCDVSEGGVLMCVGRPLDLAPGDRLLVGIPEPGRSLISKDEMVSGDIVRVLGTPSGGAAIAVRLERPAALRRAA